MHQQIFDALKAELPLLPRKIEIEENGKSETIVTEIFILPAGIVQDFGGATFKETCQEIADFCGCEMHILPDGGYWFRRRKA